MVDKHQDLGPEFQRLAQTILAVLEPLALAAMSRAAQSGEASKCQQVWCPVCAMAALMSGEQHPLTAVVAEHAAAVLAQIRAFADLEDSHPPEGGAHAHRPEQSSEDPGRYQPISVTIHD